MKRSRSQSSAPDVRAPSKGRAPKATRREVPKMQAPTSPHCYKQFSNRDELNTHILDQHPHASSRDQPSAHIAHRNNRSPSTHDSTLEVHGPSVLNPIQSRTFFVHGRSILNPIQEAEQLSEQASGPLRAAASFEADSEKCPHCRKTYGVRSSLRRHVRDIHSGAPPSTCLYCSKSFPHKTSLSRHMSRVHKANPSYKCFNCARKYKTREELQAHACAISPLNSRNP